MSITGQEIMHPLAGKTCRVLRNVWGDIHEADLTIPAGSMLGRVRPGRSDRIYVVEYQGHHFRVMDDNLEVVP